MEGRAFLCSWWRRGRERCSLFAKHADREDPRGQRGRRDARTGRGDGGESDSPVNTATPNIRGARFLGVSLDIVPELQLFVQ